MIKDMEDNENSFVALWSEKVELNCAVLYANSIMNDDNFFNRVTDIDCHEFGMMMDNAEREFSKRGVKPFVHCFSNEKLRNELTKRNYVLYDLIHTLHFGNAELEILDNIVIKSANTNNIGDWISVFCEAFQSEKWNREINRAVIATLDKILFYLAYYDTKLVGCVALLPTKGLLGLYCLGILTKYRGKGIGTALIAKAAAIASEKKLLLYLQTFMTDGLIDFYQKLGFTETYVKEIWSK